MQGLDVAIPDDREASSASSVAAVDQTGSISVTSSRMQSILDRLLAPEAFSRRRHHSVNGILHILLFATGRADLSTTGR